MRYKNISEKWGDAVEVEISDIRDQAGTFGLDPDSIEERDGAVYCDGEMIAVQSPSAREKAEAWIDSQDTGYARIRREKAKYLVGKIIPSEMPHPAVWNEVLNISRGIEEERNND